MQSLVPCNQNHNDLSFLHIRPILSPLHLNMHVPHTILHKVREALMGIVDGCITLQIGEMSRRTEEIFERGAGGSINDQVHQLIW